MIVGLLAAILVVLALIVLLLWSIDSGISKANSELRELKRLKQQEATDRLTQ